LAVARTTIMRWLQCFVPAFEKHWKRYAGMTVDRMRPQKQENETVGKSAQPSLGVTSELRDLSLLGGPLYRLGNRLGLIRERSDLTFFGLAFGLSLWIVLGFLTFIQGTSDQIFSLSVISAHVRLLVTIPLFFVCEGRLDPHLTRFVRTIVRARVVPNSALPLLETKIASIARWRESWIPETICFLAVVLMTAFLPRIYLITKTVHVIGSVGIASDWYWLVCMTLFRFLILRWFWHLCLWWHFLWFLSRLDLHLVPTHPDRAGGLGYVSVIHTQFAALILALSAFQSATFAEQISSGGMTLRDFYPQIIILLILYAILFLGPLLIFFPILAACRSRGQADYGELASRYVNEFDKKWVHAATPPEEPLLGTPDMQSLADLINSVTATRSMGLVPVSLALIQWLTLAALLPMLPLVLLIYPFASLAIKFCERIVGLTHVRSFKLQA
jgi:hypothetical protein